MTPEEERKKKNVRYVMLTLIWTFLIGFMLGVLAMWLVANVEVGLR